MHIKKCYGKDFEVIGKINGWDIAEWIGCKRPIIALLKPLNENDFIFSCQIPMKDNEENAFCGVLKNTWFAFINGEYIEMDSGDIQAQELLNSKLKEYEKFPKVSPGDFIIIKDIDGKKVKREVIGYYYTENDIWIRYKGIYIDTEVVKVRTFGKNWTK